MYRSFPRFCTYPSNEITFDDAEGNIMSFFTSASDDKTEAEWNQLVKKYGINAPVLTVG